MFYLAHSLYISAYIHVHVCMASLMAPVTVEGGKVWFRQPSPVLSSDTGWQRSGERVFAEQKGEKIGWQSNLVARSAVLLLLLCQCIHREFA